MKKNDWRQILKKKYGTKTQIGRALSVKYYLMHRWMTGSSIPSIYYAYKINQDTNGEIEISDIIKKYKKIPLDMDIVKGIYKLKNQKKLADAIGTSQATITRALNGQLELKEHLREKLKQVLK